MLELFCCHDENKTKYLQGSCTLDVQYEVLLIFNNNNLLRQLFLQLYDACKGKTPVREM